MAYYIEDAVPRQAVKIAELLHTSMENGPESAFKIDKERLLNHVLETITSTDGFSVVLKHIDAFGYHEDEVVGCFMGAITHHAYANIYLASELGVYISVAHRGGENFEKMLDAFIEWSFQKPDIGMTTFTIGQINATTPFIRKKLIERGFIKADESYYKRGMAYV